MSWLEERVGGRWRRWRGAQSLRRGFEVQLDAMVARYFDTRRSEQMYRLHDTPTNPTPTPTLTPSLSFPAPLTPNPSTPTAGDPPRLAEGVQGHRREDRPGARRRQGRRRQGRRHGQGDGRQGGESPTHARPPARPPKQLRTLTAHTNHTAPPPPPPGGHGQGDGGARGGGDAGGRGEGGGRGGVGRRRGQGQGGGVGGLGGQRFFMGAGRTEGKLYESGLTSASWPGAFLANLKPPRLDAEIRQCRP
jgi:hypothetical protein